MKNTIYIHIGLPKTGTSYLQSLFAINSELYREKGLIYPDLTGNFKEARLGKTTSGNGLRLAATSIPELLKPFQPYNLHDFRNNFDKEYNYLISCEWLSECQISFFDTINKLFNDKFNVKYIAYVRDPIDKIKSNYYQNLKIGDYCEDIDYYLNELIDSEIKHLNLLNNFEYDIEIVNYDVHKDDLLGSFEKIIFNEVVTKKIPTFTVNPSPDHHQSQVIKLINKLKISNTTSVMNYLENDNYLNEINIKRPQVSTQEVWSDIKKQVEKLNIRIDEQLEMKAYNGFIFESNDDISLKDSDYNLISELIEAKIKSVTYQNLRFILYCIGALKIENYKNLPDDFNMISYLIRNLDIVEKRVNPFWHYINYGKREGRVYK